MTPTHIQPELEHLDALIAKLKNSAGRELVIEHLQTAHAYLHGAMPVECVHNLQLARDAADLLSPQPLRNEVKEEIAGLLKVVQSASRPHGVGLRAVATKAAPVTAKGVTEFLHGEDVSFGIFYPKKHVVAVFPSVGQAQDAYRVLSGAGFRMWEIIVVSGPEVERFLEEIRMNRTLWDELVKEVSKFLDTEINLVEHYGQWAHEGYGFLVVRCPDNEAADSISALLDPVNPVAMHWFMSSGIRHLTEGN